MKYPTFCITFLLIFQLQPRYIHAQEDIGISETVSEEPSENKADTPLTNATSSTVQEPPTSTGAKSSSSYENTSFSDQTGTIIIRTTPDSVTVDINGTRLGLTPWNRKGFLPGFYRVKLDKTGYRQFQKTVQIRGGDTVYVVHDLESAVSTSSTYYTETDFSDNVPSNAISNTPPESEAPTDSPVRPPPPAGTGTLAVTCNADSANVVINKVKLGVTPFIRKGFQPGFYEVELKKSGYEPFRKMVKVENDDTTRVEAVLAPFFGRLIVASTPDSVKVLINDVVCGITPFDSTGIKPNLYRIRLELDGYVPWTTQRTIEKNRTDSLNVALMSITTRDSLNKVNARRFKIVRRVVFGTLTAGFLAAGTYYNSRAEQQLSVEKEAWNAYMEANRSTAEYDARFAEYERVAETTDLFLKRRNAMYVAGGIFCIGLALSIPF